MALSGIWFKGYLLSDIALSGITFYGFLLSDFALSGRSFYSFLLSDTYLTGAWVCDFYLSKFFRSDITGTLFMGGLVCDIFLNGIRLRYLTGKKQIYNFVFCLSDVHKSSNRDFCGLGSCLCCSEFFAHINQFLALLVHLLLLLYNYYLQNSNYFRAE